MAQGVYIRPFCAQDLEELDPDFIMAKQVEQLEKEKKELQERLKNQEKKVRVVSSLFQYHGPVWLSTALANSEALALRFFFY